MCVLYKMAAASKAPRAYSLSSAPTELSASIVPVDAQIQRQETPLPVGHSVYLLVGKRGSGKSTLALNLLKRKTSPYYKHFDNVYLISPTANRDPKFDSLIEELSADGKYFDTLTEPIVEDVIAQLQTFNDEYKECHRGGEPHNLLILDDCIHLLPTSTQKSAVNQLFTNGRHLKLSVWVMSQQLTKINRLARTNADLLTYFPNDSAAEMRTLESEWAIEPKLLKSVYEYAVALPNSWLHISFAGRAPRFYRKFDEISVAVD